MSRTMQDIQKEYSAVAIDLGSKTFQRNELIEELERVEYACEKLINKMQSLVKEANKIKTESVPAEATEPVALPESESSNEQN